MPEVHNKRPADLTRRVKEFVVKKGATLVGISSIDRFAEAPKNHHPSHFMPTAKSVVSTGLRISKSSILGLPATIKEYKLNYEMANLKLNTLTWETVCFLENLGHQALAVPASSPYDKRSNFGDVSHKHAAVACGLGSFGLNNLILTRDHGAYMRFATVITNAELRPDPLLKQDLCLREKCLKCVEACPVEALDNPIYDAHRGWKMNKRKCEEYLKVVSDGDVCGLCIRACPKMIKQRL